MEENYVSRAHFEFGRFGLSVLALMTKTNSRERKPKILEGDGNEKIIEQPPTSIFER